MSETLIEKRVTHTHKSPEGVIVVVSGIPAQCAQNSDGEPYFYDFDVALRLEELINAALARKPSPGAVVHVAWDEKVEAIKPPADVEIRVRGEGIIFGSTSISVWRKILDRAHGAYQAVARVLAEKEGRPVPPPPVLAFTLPGSLVIGLRSQETPLFAEHDLSSEALRLIVEGVRWAEDGVPKNDPVLEETVLRAVEELSPSGREEIREIEITYQAPHRLRTQAVLTPETHKKAVERRVELARQEEQAKPVVLAGLLDEIKLDDVFHLAQLEEFPDHHRTTTARVFYPRILLPILLQLFGQRVRVVAEGVKNSTGKFEYRALSIEPLEPLEK